ncbi:MAG: ATP-binding protein [Thermoleophilia bacterium]
MTPGTAAYEGSVAMSFPAEADSLAIIRQAITGIAEVLGMSPPRIDDVKVAVTEAGANVVMHAYAGGRGVIELDAGEDAGRMVVVVRDRGGGIVPRVERDSPGLGLGLQMIAALTEEMTVSANEDGAGTVVRMTFAVE